jgi:hypothetical protein
MSCVTVTGACWRRFFAPGKYLWENEPKELESVNVNAMVKAKKEREEDDEKMEEEDDGDYVDEEEVLRRLGQDGFALAVEQVVVVRVLRSGRWNPPVRQRYIRPTAAIVLVSTDGADPGERT